METAHARLSKIPAERAQPLVTEQFTDSSARDAEDDAVACMSGDAAPDRVEGTVDQCRASDQDDVYDDEIEVEVAPPPGYSPLDILGAEITSINGESVSVPGYAGDYDDDCLEFEFNLPPECDEANVAESCLRLQLDDGAGLGHLPR